MRYQPQGRGVPVGERRMGGTATSPGSASFTAGAARGHGGRTPGDGVTLLYVLRPRRAQELTRLVRRQSASVSPIGYPNSIPRIVSPSTGGVAGGSSASTTNSDVMYPRLGATVSGRADKLTRSSLLPNHLLTMSLTCIPKPCSCGVKLPVHGVVKGFTHPKQAPCPFSVQDFPKKRFGTCCSLQSSIAYWHLIAFGEDLLAARLDCPMTVEQASAFAETLRQAMNRLEERYGDGHPKPEGARNLTYWRKNRTEFVWHRRSTFEEAVAAVRLAAAWFELVSRRGYGVAVK